MSAYAGFLLEDYPPFSFSTTDGDPGDNAGVQVAFGPELEDRNRVTTFFRWLLVIPHMIVLFFLGIAASLAWIVAFFVVLFTGRWPSGIRELVVGYMRWNVRVSAYSLLLTDEYPPFSIQ